MKLNPSSVVAQPVVASERLLAISSLLKRGSRDFDFQLHGKSMAPALPDGSWIRVRPAADGRFTVGQVLTYVAKDRVVAHRLVLSMKSRSTEYLISAGNQILRAPRVIRYSVLSMKSRSTEYLITRGDATVCCDWPVPATSVLGTVIGFSADRPWQPVGPPPERWLGFRSTALLISSVVAHLLKVSPRAAVFTAKRFIRIHGMVERAMGYLKRRVVLGSRRGVAL